MEHTMLWLKTQFLKEWFSSGGKSIMKIAIIDPSPAFNLHHQGAAGMVVRYLIGGSAYRDSCRLFTEEVPEAVPDLPYEFFPSHLKREEKIKAVARGVRDFGADIVEVHHDNRFATSLARKLRGLPLLLVMHRVYEKENLWNRIFRSLRFYPFKRIICVSEYAAETYRRAYPEHAKRVIALRNALPFERFLGNREEEREKVIFWAGRGVPEKGLWEFMQAMEKTLPHCSGWRAVVASLAHDQTFTNEVRARFEPSLGDRCLWFANLPHPEVITWMKRAAIFVAPSKCEEAFCLALLEAHLAGAAVVSSGRGGMPEVSGKEGALTLPEVSEQAIAKAVRHLIENEEERLALAKRGQDYVLKHHNIKDRAAELDALRRKLTGKK